jgi:hypothetical protein
MTAPTIDTHQWLTAIDDDPRMTGAELLTGYRILGAETDQTAEQFEESSIRLHFAGFLRPVAIDGDTYTYELRIPVHSE